MAQTNAERQRAYRERKRKGIAFRRKAPVTQADRKRKVLTHYGNGECACVRCGESRLACLSIDHINGGGNRQRKGKLRSSGGFYRWLIGNNYPAGYQTLCMNDQFIKRFERNEHN